MDFLTAVGDFMSSRPILGVLALTVLVALVGWEATHPPVHPEEKHHG
jgi:hypothetical protein